MRQGHAAAKLALRCVDNSLGILRIAAIDAGRPLWPEKKNRKEEKKKKKKNM